MGQQSCSFLKSSHIFLLNFEFSCSIIKRNNFYILHATHLASSTGIKLLCYSIPPFPLWLSSSSSPSQSSSCCPRHCCRPPLPTHGSCWFLCPVPWGLLSPARTVCLCWTDCCCSLHVCIYKHEHTDKHTQWQRERKVRQSKILVQKCTFKQNI